MATASQNLNGKFKCPLCGATVKESDLGRAGVTKIELDIVKRYAREGTLGKLLQMVDIVMSKLDPERMNKELLTKNAVAEILKALGIQEIAVKNSVEDMMKILNDLRLKIAGPGIGKIGESITLKDFKAAMPIDGFSEEKADKHGTDIVATVNENKTAIGKIAISVKYDNNWKSEFIHQLQQNMVHEGTDFGILATLSLPREALSNKVLVIETPASGMILVVKQEYAAVAYYGLRQALLAWEKAKKTISDAQNKMEEKSRVFKAVIDWINGRRLKETLEYIRASKELGKEISETATQIRDHTIRKVKNLLELQQQIQNNLTYANDSVNELKRLLDDGKPTKPSP
jgi:hypothetical protein